MKRIIPIGLIALTTAACGSSQDFREISGSLSRTDFPDRSAEVVATNGFGTKIVGAVADDGFFSIPLETDQVYAIGFRAPGDKGRFFAQMTFRDARTTFRAIAGPAIPIGGVHRDRSASQLSIGDCWGTENSDPVPSQIFNFLVVGDEDLVDRNEPTDETDLSGPLGDDDGDQRRNDHDDDDDDDGICDEDDDGRTGCDDEDSDAGVCDDADTDTDTPCDDESEDAGTCDGGEDAGSRADIPYDVRPQLGDEFALMNAFLEEGEAPAEILSVEMDDGNWRLTELQNNTRFTITQEDCDHEGNRDTGRDRIVIAWRNQDGSTDLDHLDLRYCKD